MIKKWDGNYLMFKEYVLRSLRLNTLWRSKKIVVATLLIITTAFYFWTSSRYPALDEKAALGDENDISGIAFDSILQNLSSTSITNQIINNAINWAYTNQQGMTFGLIFAALLLTLFQLIQQRRFKSRVVNTLLGVVIGAPMGICVNCSVPIAIGLHQSGSRLETSLAALFSSPTLNVIVLTMLISLFPPWLVVLKIGLSLFFILFFVPIIARFTEIKNPNDTNCNLAPSKQKKVKLPYGGNDSARSDSDDEYGEITAWFIACLWVIKDFIYNFYKIVIRTVPFMVVAGFFGAVVITLLPWETLSEVLPTSGISFFLSLILISVMGTFLPIPIAFDVVICSILISVGMDIRYVATLLFTLGIFSIYPTLQLGHSISWKLSKTLFISVVFLGIIAGITAGHLNEIENNRQQTMIQQILNSQTKPSSSSFLNKQGEKKDRFKLPITTQAFSPSLLTHISQTGDKVNISWSQFRMPSPYQHILFTRVYGYELGVIEPDNISILRYLLPLSENRSVASGDTNNDGWPDLLLTSEDGISLYINIEGKKFIQQPISLKEYNDVYITNAALVDFDGDTDLDIIAGTFRHGILIKENSNGKFENKAIQIKNRRRYAVTGALAFGDLDRDGDLDFIVGNRALGNSNLGKINRSLSDSKNYLYKREKGSYIITEMMGAEGETLSILLSDLNGDDWLDIYIGNDFAPPDELLLSDGNGKYNYTNKEDNLIMNSTKWTMSIASADLDGDLIPELYLGGISGRKTAAKRAIEKECRFETEAEKKSCIETGKNLQPLLNARKKGFADDCRDSKYSKDCALLAMISPAMRSGNTGRNAIGSLCDEIPKKWIHVIALCEARKSEKIKPLNETELNNTLQSSIRDNLLLKRNNYNSPYNDISKNMKMDNAGWTLNAKFADLDLDGKQDLYLVNGATIAKNRYDHKLYLNKGSFFEESAEVSGIASGIPTSSYTYVDLDRDGDLDIVSVPVIGNVRFFINGAKTIYNNSIAIRLDNNSENSYAIGAKVILKYGNNSELTQMREIQASGGFASFDEAIAHFGLGEYASISSIEIHWPDGKITMINETLPANRYYFVERDSNIKQ